MALPPFDDGALQLTDAWAFPAVALTPVGAPVIVIGVIALEADDAALFPTAVVATTVNV
jgi:hypothetical protein